MSDARPYHHGDLRNTLIAIGLQVLADEGPRGLSLRKVARLAGVSHNAPYMHFADREALLLAIAERGFRRLEAAMRQVLDETPAGSAAQLLALAGSYVRFALDHPHELSVMFADLGGAGAVQPWPGEAAGATYRLLAEAIEAGQRSGAIRAGDPGLLASAVWATVHGLCTLMIARRFTPPTLPGAIGGPPTVSQVIEVLYSGLRPG